MNADSTPLVALPTSLYADGKHCGKQVMIKNTANGKTVVAKVQDMCPGCPSDTSLDVSGLQACSSIPHRHVDEPFSATTALYRRLRRNWRAICWCASHRMGIYVNIALATSHQGAVPSVYILTKQLGEVEEDDHAPVSISHGHLYIVSTSLFYELLDCAWKWVV